MLVYLPTGALLTALEDTPETVAKGRARVDQELRNAKIVGRFAVGIAWRQLRGQIDSFASGLSASGAGEEREAAGTSARPRKRQETAGNRPRSATPRPATPRPARDAEVDRAIPDYDILAASQVVRRLDGLGRDELRAVARHERATRGRRTILHRAEQLLGDTGRTGDTDAGSGPTGSDRSR